MATDTFPAGLRVLAVDDDRVCLKVLERQLTYCNYNATMVTNAQTALEMLRERKDENQFDLVISNVSTKMDGFKLLELIGLEMDRPVIMTENPEVKSEGASEETAQEVVQCFDICGTDPDPTLYTI